MKHAWALAAALAMTWCGAAAADELPAETAVSVVGPTVPAGTVVLIQIAEYVSSQTAKAGDKFAIVLAKPIVAEGGLPIPAGLKGVGEVVYATPAAKYGRAGELVLAARYLELDGRKIPLKAFKFGGAGESRSEDVAVLGLLAPLPSLFIVGGIKGDDMNVGAGTVANAKLAADLVLPVQASAGESHE